MEFLAGDTAQHMYADVNAEYPVKAGVEPSAMVKSWGSFKSDRYRSAIMPSTARTPCSCWMK
jgi:ABC-type Fe3+ transport system substrate-binding protein